MQMRVFAKTAVFAAVILMLQTAVLPCFAAESVSGTAENGTTDIKTESTEQLMGLSAFFDYLELEEQVFPKQRIAVINSAVKLSAGKSTEKSFSVEEAGYYAIKLSYSVDNSLGQYPALTVMINGAVPFAEASSLNLMRRWSNEEKTAEPMTDSVVPKLVENKEVQTGFLYDTIKYYGGILYFYLRQGENTLQINMDSEDITIYSLSFENPAEKPQYSPPDGEIYDGEPIYTEGEDACFMSDASVLPYNDPSSAAISPSSPYVKYLNVIGGTSWSDAGQYIEWKFQVPRDGCYRLAVKYRQNTNYALNSSRRILIDGEVPFSELENVTFPYSPTYRNQTVSVDGKDVYFYLTKGLHTVRMEVTIGDLNRILSETEKVVSELNSAYRQIIMITGTDPDSLRDYNLEKSVPDTLATLKDQREKLSVLAERMYKISGGASSGTRIMNAVCKQLSDFEKDSARITAAFADFKSNISSLGTWLVNAKSQPLSIDWLCLYGNRDELRPAKAGFLQAVKFQFCSFLHTFSTDYQSVREEQRLTVWMSAGSTQHRIFKQLSEASFKVGGKEIKTDIKLVTSGLLSAIISGKEPDVAIDLLSNDIMNYAFRKCGVDITRFEDYEDVAKHFRVSSLVPVTFDGKVYALPQTQAYQIMFYRTDILNELNISVPQTWEEVVSVMAALKKKNLEFGIPLGTSTYTTLLFQRGKSFYNDKLTATALTDYDSLDAFQTCCSWFTQYKTPISYDGLQRFRTGEMPILIADFPMYNSIDILAPEIKGQWGMTMIPGTVREDGSLDRSAAMTGTYGMILKEEKADIAWEFLKWWTDEETQIQYAQRIEMALGQSGRYNSANIDAFARLGYPADAMRVIEEQGEHTVSIPAVPGSYYLERYLINAMNKALYQGEDPADALIAFSKIIDSEIQYKREEFGLS